MSFNKAFKKRHKLLNPKRALLIFTFIISTKLIPARQAEGERGGMWFARNLHLQHCKRSRAAQYVYMHWGHTHSQCYKKVQVQERPRPLSHAFLPQTLTCTLTATWSVRVTFGGSDSLCASLPLPPNPQYPSLLPFFLFIVLPALLSPAKSTRLASHIWIMPVKWRRHCWALILSGFDAPPSPGHIWPHPAPGWLAVIDDTTVLYWILLCLDLTLRVAVIKCAD